MKTICLNVERAVAHLEKFSDQCSEALIQVLKDHAVDNEHVVIDTDQGMIIGMSFEATYDIQSEIEAGDSLIIIHTANGAATATVKTNPVTDHEVVDIDGKPIFIDQQNNLKETTMNTSTQTTRSSAPPVYSAEEREALLAKMAAMQATMDKMSKGQPKPATAEPKDAAKPAASEDDNGLAMAIGKGVLYTAGAVAVGVGGWFAWKKWGSSSTQA